MKNYLKLLLVGLGIGLFPGSVQALEGGYQDGLYLKSEDGAYSLKTNFQLQFQHQFLSVDGQGKTSSFQLRRGRIFFSGNALGENLTYLFHFEFVGGQTNNVSKAVAFTGPNLRDGYVNYNFDNGIEIRAGQFKVPYSFEELVSDTKSQWIDRTIANDAFTFNRDLGVNLHGRIIDKKLEYNLCVMNEGNNQNTANRNNAMLYGARVAWNFLGDHGYVTGDPENSQEPQLMVGVAANLNRVGSPTTADQSVISTTGDVAVRYRWISGIGAGYYQHNHTAATDTYGFLAQTGYFVLPKRLELMARFAGVVPTAAGVTNGYEAGGGISYYFKGHNFKLTTDYAVLINSPLVLGIGGAAGKNNPTNISASGGAPGFVQGQNDHRVRTQLQVVF